ncbi:hypothetical protein [Dactylosporangium salmoneum]|uniref:Uncharacterized protein n=1 Tax=Dactylosporangium salmoneum TaxID=53361 RepID=A0ABP5TVK3_9ACTN
MTESEDARAGREVLPLHWWYEDPERWQLLEFDEGHNGEGAPIDRLGRERQQVLEMLARTTDRADADFARFLLAQEILRHGHCWSFNHSIEIAALLVAEHRDVSDIWLLWKAVCRSFDTWCGLPHRLLYAAGVAVTAEHVRSSTHPQRDGLLDLLNGLAGTTDEQVTRLLIERRGYYRNIFDELHPPQ